LCVHRSPLQRGWNNISRLPPFQGGIKGGKSDLRIQGIFFIENVLGRSAKQTQKSCGARCACATAFLGFVMLKLMLRGTYRLEASIKMKTKKKVPTICKIGFDSAQPLMAERSRSHITWHSNLLLLAYQELKFLAQS